MIQCDLRKSSQSRPIETRMVRSFAVPVQFSEISEKKKTGCGCGCTQKRKKAKPDWTFNHYSQHCNCHTHYGPHQQAPHYSCHQPYVHSCNQICTHNWQKNP